MKQFLLEIDAMLSCVVAELSMPAPDTTRAQADINLARDRLLALAQEIEGAERN